MTQRLTILYVDDDPDLREIVTAALEMDPALSVRTAGRAEEALAAVALETPDILMLDVMMPGMDGPALLARLRFNGTRAMPTIIFITAKAQAAEIERLMALGAAGVIRKPFDPRTLAGSLRSFRDLGQIGSGFDTDYDPSADLEALQAGFAARFRRQAAETAGSLENALARDPAALLAMAHMLAGTAGTLGFTDIGKEAGALEAALKTGSPPEARSHARALIRLLLDISHAPPDTGA